MTVAEGTQRKEEEGNEGKKLLTIQHKPLEC